MTQKVTCTEILTTSEALDILAITATKQIILNQGSREGNVHKRGIPDILFPAPKYYYFQFCDQ